MSLGNPEITGYAFSWSSLRTEENGTEYPGIVAINWKAAAERAFVYGHGRESRARTRGRVSYEGGLTWIKENFLDFKNAKNGGVGILDETFHFIVDGEEAEAGNLVQIEFIGASFQEISGDYSESPDGLQIVTPLDVMRIKIDGKFLVKPT